LAWLSVHTNQRVGVRVRAERKKHMGTESSNWREHRGECGNRDGDDDADRRAQFHQSRLMERVNDFSAAYHNTLNGMQVS